MVELRTAHLLTLKLVVAGMQPVGEILSGNRPPEGPAYEIYEVL